MLKLNFSPKISSCLNKWLVWSLKHAVSFTQCVPNWIGMNPYYQKVKRPQILAIALFYPGGENSE